MIYYEGSFSSLTNNIYDFKFDGLKETYVKKYLITLGIKS
jgi:hypothetical protein